MKRYKIILILSGIIISIGLVCYLQYQKIKAIKEKTTLQVENNFLHKKIKELNSELETFNVLRTELEDKNKIIAENAEKDQIRQDLINKRNQEKEKQAERVSNDSSFRYEDNKRKPQPNEKREYCFTGSQVKKMHIDDIKFESLEDRHKGIIRQYAACKKMLKNSTKQNRLANKEIKNLKEQNNLKDSIIFNKDAEIKVLSKDLNRRKGGNIFWKVIAGTGIATVIIKSL